MDVDFEEAVYGTVMGELIRQAYVPGVEDLFRSGGPGAKLLSRAYDARERLRRKYPMEEEEEDMLEIFDCFLDMCRLVGMEMYRCGALFGPGEAAADREGLYAALPAIEASSLCRNKDCARAWRRAMYSMSDEEFQKFWKQTKIKNGYPDL